MKVIYHRLAARDVRQILDHYDSEAGPKLADRFFEDLLGTIAKCPLESQEISTRW